MEKGYNSDIHINGNLFHVQTEDWGPELKILITRVFKNGAVINSFKTPYQQIIPTIPLSVSESRPRLREALRNQHRKILDLLQSGQLLYEKAKIKG